MTAERDQLAKEKAVLAERLNQSEARASRLSADLAAVTAAKTDTDKSLSEMTASRGQVQQTLDDCRIRNREMRDLVDELMTKYREVGFWDVLKRREPFTGLRRAQVDNLLESVRERAEDAQVTPAR